LEPPESGHEPDELVPEPPLSMIRVVELEDPLVPAVEVVDVLVEPVELVPLVELVGTVYATSLE